MSYSVHTRGGRVVEFSTVDPVVTTYINRLISHGGHYREGRELFPLRLIADATDAPSLSIGRLRLRLHFHRELRRHHLI